MEVLVLILYNIFENIKVGPKCFGVFKNIPAKKKNTWQHLGNIFNLNKFDLL